MPRALISVSDKTGVVEFARGLEERGWQIISTGGTYGKIKEAKVGVMKVSDLTGMPEVMGGRVKTLHHSIAGGILARRDNSEHMHALHEVLRAGPIDMVAVNLYPFAAAATKMRNGEIGLDDLIEEIDIGGPTLVRAAAKNFQHVTVVVDPTDYDAVLESLDQNWGVNFRYEMARKAFQHTADYDTMIANTLDDARLTRAEEVVLRCGENPHQNASWGPDPNLRLVSHQGKKLSFTNLLDLEAALRISLEFDEPAAVVIKHESPCGVAIGDSAAEAYIRARSADEKSAYGSIVGLNLPLDATTAMAITSTFLECVIAPAVSDEALHIMSRKPDIRVLTADYNEARAALLQQEVRTKLIGTLRQDRDYVAEAMKPWPYDNEGESYPKVVTRRSPTPSEWIALRFAWRVCAHVKSNSVIFTEEDVTVGIGGGQPNRDNSAKIGRGFLDLEFVDRRYIGAPPLRGGTVAASDAFFPFRDGLDQVARAGATAVVQPGGSKRDQEVIDAANEHGIAMVFTGRRHFRH